MKISISLALDVDHIPGRRLKKTNTLHDKFDTWKKHAEWVNTHYLGDDAEITADSSSVKYDVGGKVFAVWDKRKKVGTVNDKGNELIPGEV